MGGGGKKKSSLPLSTNSQKRERVRKKRSRIIDHRFPPLSLRDKSPNGVKKVNTLWEVENEKWGRETNVRLVSYRLIRDISCKKFFFSLFFFTTCIRIHTAPVYIRTRANVRITCIYTYIYRYCAGNCCCCFFLLFFSFFLSLFFFNHIYTVDIFYNLISASSPSRLRFFPTLWQ